MYLCSVIVKVLHKFSAIVLSLLVLFSTLSFTVEKHFCGNTLIDVAVFSQVEKCAMEAYEIEKTAITKKSCCKDEVKVIQGQDELNLKSFDDLKFSEQVFLVAFTHSYNNLFEYLPELIIPFKEYSPPKIVRDIHVLDEVYLI